MRMNSTIDSFETAHYGNLLQRAGYTTAYFGKYLNPPAMEPYCKDGGTPSHPVNSGEFKRLPGWDHQLTMCNTECELQHIRSYVHPDLLLHHPMAPAILVIEITVIAWCGRAVLDALPSRL